MMLQSPSPVQEGASLTRNVFSGFVAFFANVTHLLRLPFTILWHTILPTLSTSPPIRTLEPSESPRNLNLEGVDEHGSGQTDPRHAESHAGSPSVKNPATSAAPIIQICIPSEEGETSHQCFGVSADTTVAEVLNLAVNSTVIDRHTVPSDTSRLDSASKIVRMFPAGDGPGRATPRGSTYVVAYKESVQSASWDPTSAGFAVAILAVAASALVWIVLELLSCLQVRKARLTTRPRMRRAKSLESTLTAAGVKTSSDYSNEPWFALDIDTLHNDRLAAGNDAFTIMSFPVPFTHNPEADIDQPHATVEDRTNADDVVVADIPETEIESPLVIENMETADGNATSPENLDADNPNPTDSAPFNMPHAHADALSLPTLDDATGDSTHNTGTVGKPRSISTETVLLAVLDAEVTTTHPPAPEGPGAHETKTPDRTEPQVDENLTLVENISYMDSSTSDEGRDSAHCGIAAPSDRAGTHMAVLFAENHAPPTKTPLSPPTYSDKDGVTIYHGEASEESINVDGTRPAAALDIIRGSCDNTPTLGAESDDSVDEDGPFRYPGYESDSDGEAETASPATAAADCHTSSTKMVDDESSSDAPKDAKTGQNDAHASPARAQGNRGIDYNVGVEGSQHNPANKQGKSPGASSPPPTTHRRSASVTSTKMNGRGFAGRSFAGHITSSDRPAAIVSEKSVSPRSTRPDWAAISWLGDAAATGEPKTRKPDPRPDHALEARRAREAAAGLAPSTTALDQQRSDIAVTCARTADTAHEVAVVAAGGLRTHGQRDSQPRTTGDESVPACTSSSASWSVQPGVGGGSDSLLPSLSEVPEDLQTFNGDLPGVSADAIFACSTSEISVGRPSYTPSTPQSMQKSGVSEAAAPSHVSNDPDATEPSSQTGSTELMVVRLPPSIEESTVAPQVPQTAVPANDAVSHISHRPSLRQGLPIPTFFAPRPDLPPHHKTVQRVPHTLSLHLQPMASAYQSSGRPLAPHQFRKDLAQTRDQKYQ